MKRKEAGRRGRKVSRPGGCGGSRARSESVDGERKEHVRVRQYPRPAAAEAAGPVAGGWLARRRWCSGRAAGTHHQPTDPAIRGEEEAGRTASGSAVVKRRAGDSAPTCQLPPTRRLRRRAPATWHPARVVPDPDQWVSRAPAPPVSRIGTREWGRIVVLSVPPLCPLLHCTASLSVSCSILLWSLKSGREFQLSLERFFAFSWRQQWQ